MEFNRKKNAKRTIISGIVVKLLSVIVPFIMRTIIIHTLGNLYLGLGSLFSSILHTLSLFELGIGSALVFSMYKPVAENDKVKVCALLRFYKRVYLVVGIIITIIGIILLPFLPYLIIGDYPKGINIYLLYVFQLLSTVSGYFFFAYRGSVLTAYQRVDITNIVTFATEIITYLFQAISLIAFKNYYVYVALIFIRSIVNNYVIAYIAKKKYPEIIPEGDIDKEVKREIFKKTGALTGHKIAEVVVNSTDNILISMFIGLNMVAIYNNYYYVTTAVSGILLMVFTGLVPIIGNCLIKESNEKINDLFGILTYINAYLVAVCCTCFVNMYQPFISIWTGEENLFPFYMVFLFTGYFYILRIRTIILVFNNAAGIWEKDLKKAYIMTLLNLIIDIVLMPVIGIPAALISTIISMVFAYIYEIVIVHKYILKCKAKYYCINNAIYFICTVIACAISILFMPMYQHCHHLIQMIIGGVVSITSVTVCFACLTSRSKQFRGSIDFIFGKKENNELCNVSVKDMKNSG